ncbi:MAG: hypothetical protein M1823_005204 [Watsoniomyces obsoletus]|nr:MAG: hypothetical protein M1823_005204 [Watsoniomyces obsoletus]
MGKRSREQSESDSLSPVLSSISLPTSIALDEPEQPSKYPHLDDPSPLELIRCALPPHGSTMTFPSYDAYEVHYQQMHANRCAECGRNFPTEHFLGLHIAENHDPLNRARKARGEKIYACFVEDCDRVCSAPPKRRLHLIDKHMYPKNYDFAIVNHGIDQRTSMLRSPREHRRRSSAGFHTVHRERRRSATLESLRSPGGQTGSSQGQPNGTPAEGLNGSHSKAQQNASKPVSFSRKDSVSSEDSDSTGSESTEGEQTPRVPNAAPRTNGIQHTPPKQDEEDMASLTKSMSALRFVPPSVRLGAGKKKHG